jgi:hypothetical protein
VVVACTLGGCDGDAISRSGSGGGLSGSHTWRCLGGVWELVAGWWSAKGDLGGLGPPLLPLPTHSPTGVHGYAAVALGMAASGGAKGGLGGRVASAAPP